VKVFFCSSNFVVVHLSAQMHEIQFVDKPFTFEQFQGSVDRRPVDLHLLLCHFEQSGCIEMAVRLFQDFEQRPAP